MISVNLGKRQTKGDARAGSVWRLRIWRAAFRSAAENRSDVARTNLGAL